MLSIALALALLTQCPGGVCPAPTARYSVTIVRPATPNYSAIPNSCTAPRRFRFRLFKGCR